MRKRLLLHQRRRRFFELLGDFYETGEEAEESPAGLRYTEPAGGVSWLKHQSFLHEIQNSHIYKRKKNVNISKVKTIFRADNPKQGIPSIRPDPATLTSALTAVLDHVTRVVRRKPRALLALMCFCSVAESSMWITTWR